MNDKSYMISTALRASDEYKLQSKLDYILSEIRKRSWAGQVQFTLYSSWYTENSIGIITGKYSQQKQRIRRKVVVNELGLYGSEK